jgi:hypothetical protein
MLPAPVGIKGKNAEAAAYTAEDGNVNNNINTRKKVVASFRLSEPEYQFYLSIARFCQEYGITDKGDIVSYIRFCMNYFAADYAKAMEHFAAKEREKQNTDNNEKNKTKALSVPEAAPLSAADATAANGNTTAKPPWQGEYERYYQWLGEHHFKAILDEMDELNNELDLL